MSYPDKPKRKRKEKPKRRNRLIIWLIIVLLLVLIGLLNLLLAYEPPIDIQHAPDGDPFTPLCQFESNPHIFVATREVTFITNILGDKIIILPRLFKHPNWIDGSPYAWGTRNGEQFIVDLNSGNISSFRDSPSYNYYYHSPTMRHLLKVDFDDAPVQKMILYSAETSQVIYEAQNRNSEGIWSPNETQLLLFNRDNTQVAQLFDLQTQAISNANLPPDVGIVIGWLDESRLLYKTKAGRLRVWDRLTNDSNSYSDVRFEEHYTTAGTQYYPNLSSGIRHKKWIGGFDSSGSFTLINVFSGQHISFPIDTSQFVEFTVKDRFVEFEFDTEPPQIKFYYPDTETMVDFDPAVDGHQNISHDGKYVFYRSIGEQIQEVATGNMMRFEEDDIRQFEWKQIEEQSYILYSVPVEGGANVFYLFQPDIRERCKVGTFYTEQIKLHI